MVYIVSSYDFGGSSYVQLHIVTNDKEKAQKVYDEVLAKADAKNKKYSEQSHSEHFGYSHLVELTESQRTSVATLREVQADKEYIGSDSITIHWGRNAIVNNNKLGNYIRKSLNT